MGNYDCTSGTSGLNEGWTDNVISRIDCTPRIRVSKSVDFLTISLDVIKQVFSHIVYKYTLYYLANETSAEEQFLHLQSSNRLHSYKLS